MKDPLDVAFNNVFRSSNIHVILSLTGLNPKSVFLKVECGSDREEGFVRHLVK